MESFIALLEYFKGSIWYSQNIVDSTIVKDSKTFVKQQQKDISYESCYFNNN